jgi:hypothetical protein
MLGTQNTNSPNLKTIPEIVMKTIDLREFGKTDYKTLEWVIRHFWDLYVKACVFVYCKNDFYCTTDAGYFTHFWPFQIRAGACYDAYQMRNHFLQYYNEIVERKAKELKAPSEEEIEGKIIEYFKNNVRILLRRMVIKVFKVYETERTLWIVQLPDECF